MIQRIFKHFGRSLGIFAAIVAGSVASADSKIDQVMHSKGAYDAIQEFVDHSIGSSSLAKSEVAALQSRLKGLGLAIRKFDANLGVDAVDSRSLAVWISIDEVQFSYRLQAGTGERARMTVSRREQIDAAFAQAEEVASRLRSASLGDPGAPIVEDLSAKIRYEGPRAPASEPGTIVYP